MKVAKWGNSLAVRLPRALVEELALKEGDEIELTRTGERSLAVLRDTARQDAMDRIRATRKPFPPGFKFNRDELYDTARNGFRPDPDESHE